MHPIKLTALLVFSSLVLACSSYEEDSNQDLSDYAVATFAGGCFWCVEEGFEKLPGVAEAISGYAGGEKPNPTYEQVAGGQTRHTETVQVYYDPSVIEYAGLLEAFWRMMDPTDNAGQFVDRGQQYRPEIFYHNEEQQRLAQASMQRLNAEGPFDEHVQVPITALTNFYEAEDYHQDYYRKNPVRYRLYTRNSGRYQFVDSVWGDAAEQDFTSFTNQELLTNSG
ncbi:peptide-methionine (S)-S-oxide reductase MsrA [Aliidiomarina sp. Khilg15.8]